VIRNFILTMVAATILAGAANGQTIKIGLSGPFTGPSAPMGVAMRGGANLAATAINQAGGIMGRQVVLAERDDEANPEVGAKIAQDLIGTEHVVATVGFVNNDVALASQRFYQAAEIPVLNAVASGADITRQFPPPNYIFRMSASDAIQFAMVVREAIAHHKFHAPAIMADNTSDGQAGRKYLLKELEAAGVKPVADETFNAGDTTVNMRLGLVRLANADVILTSAKRLDLAQIANAMGRQGWKLPILGNEELATSGFIDDALANGDGVSMPQTFIQVGNTPTRAAFIAAYRRTFRMTRMPSPDAAAQAYDSVYLLKAAIEQAGSTEGRDIRKALENLKTKVEGVVTIYDHPFSATDHEAISANILVMGIVRNRHVVAANEEDLAGDRAIRVKQ
jgi:branched-chain amino acid transport system substrate-binding protein